MFDCFRTCSSKNNKKKNKNNNDDSNNIKLAVNKFHLKVYIICFQSDDLDLHSRSQLCLRLDSLF